MEHPCDHKDWFREQMFYISSADIAKETILWAICWLPSHFPHIVPNDNESEDFREHKGKSENEAHRFKKK
jgi:hypothetical protein